MGGSVPKQYIKIDGLTVLSRSVKAFCAVNGVAEIVVICPAGGRELCCSVLSRDLGSAALAEGAAPRIKVCEGGAARQASVANGLATADPSADFILVHDGARPCVSADVIAGVLTALEGGAKAAVPCVRPKSTIRTVEKTLDRKLLYEVQTPQGFAAETLKTAYAKAAADGFEGTDEAGLAERAGVEITITEGSYDNVKITTPEDLPMQIRAGNGYDVHRLVEGRKLMLGCVHIPCEKGLLGHSDADVCSHAIADALLGAAALRDIGYHFPDNSTDTEGMPGTEILEKTAHLVQNAGFTIVNIDATIVAQRPKLAPYIEEMRAATAKALGLETSQVSIKATTEEGLGITGSGEAISTFATAVIR